MKIVMNQYNGLHPIQKETLGWFIYNNKSIFGDLTKQEWKELYDEYKKDCEIE